MKHSSLALSALALMLGTALPAIAQAAPDFDFDVPDGWVAKSDDTGMFLTPEASKGSEDDEIRIYLASGGLDAETKKTLETVPVAKLASSYAETYKPIAKGFQFGKPQILTDGVFPNLNISGTGTGVGPRAAWKYTMDLSFLLSSKKKARLTNPNDYLSKSEGPMLTIIILSTDLAYNKYDEDINALFGSIKLK